MLVTDLVLAAPPRLQDKVLAPRRLPPRAPAQRRSTAAVHQQLVAVVQPQIRWRGMEDYPSFAQRMFSRCVRYVGVGYDTGCPSPGRVCH
jgi:hypothetical protein